ncbi:tripartite tricarboxylate transporter permease, partial [Thermodesulfobacteriota bacterium]
MGALPGLTATTAVTLFIPVSFTLPFAAAIGLIIGLYKGAIFGGSISAISFGVPGTPAAGATILDGYQLTQRGQGRKALETGLYSSIVGDTASDLFTIFVAPLVIGVALMFGPSERFWLMALAIILIGALTGKHFFKGLLSAAIGIFIAMIGTDPMSGASRLTFGVWWLGDGIGLIPLLIGIFAMPTMFQEASSLLFERAKGKTQEKAVSPWKIGKGLSFREFWSLRKEIAIGTTVGTFVGLLPGIGASVAAFLSYAVNKQVSPEKQLGTGKIEGVAAAESANNATCGPTLVPLIAFGIPGSSIAALVGAALMLQGVRMGPGVMDLHPDKIYALFMLLILANVFNLLIGRFFCGLYVALAQSPKALIIPTILAMAVIGTYATQLNPYHIIMLVGAGLLGYIMLLTDIP